MNPPPIIRPEAELDLAEGRDWYEGKRAGLGDDFLQCAEEVLNRIREMPEMYSVVYREVRRCKLRRFPYVVYYRMRNDRVEVLGVLHGARSSGAWRSRI